MLVKGTAGLNAPSWRRSESFRNQMIEQIVKSPGNEITFLPTGLGQMKVVDAVIDTMLSRFPEKHVVVCVLRPAQVLSGAQRLRRSLKGHVSVGAYCGGDFLYDFPKEFEQNQVLVFTAGLLMRLTKLGVYRLDQSSLLVLHDAFHAVRNHPMNTLVREYYWKLAATEDSSQEVVRPKLLGTMLPQTHTLKRPFDKLRQVVRRLSHSAQAGICLPTGHALESLAQKIHCSRLAFHAYDPFQEESLLIGLIQKHLLHVWDVLHAHGQNHFGRLIHFPTVNDIMERAQFEEQENSEDLYVNPVHHDWEQINLMVDHSIAFTANLPTSGASHCRSDAALLVMEHVKSCIRALVVCMGETMKPAIDIFVSSFVQFREKLGELRNSKDEDDLETKVAKDAIAALESSPLTHSLKLDPRQDIQGILYEQFNRTLYRSSRMEMCAALLKDLGCPDLDRPVYIVVQDEASARSLIGFLSPSIPQNNLLQVEDVIEPVPAENQMIYFITEDYVAMSDRLYELQQSCGHIVWYSPASVMHAAGFDYDSTALNVLRNICGIGAPQQTENKDTTAGPYCHIIATRDQSLAWIQISKADQMLLAAAEFVHCGDASLEESLAQLAVHGKSAFFHDGSNLQPLSLAVPPPSTILHTLCLGLSGIPPTFNLYQVQVEDPHLGNGLWQATAFLPEALIMNGEGVGQVYAKIRGSKENPFVGQLAASSSEARDAAAEAALASLANSGTISAYWQTKVLVDSIMKHQETAAQGQMRAGELMGQGTSTPSIPESPFTGATKTNDIRPSDSERLICSICGIVTTSEAHLKEHEKGRRHLKNLERLQRQQEAASVPKDSIVTHDIPSSSSQENLGGIESNHSLSNTIDQLPSTLSDALMRRSSSQFSRQNSNVYDGFPCVRVGDCSLPSSMDLRAFLDEMQLGEDAKSEPSPRPRAKTQPSPRAKAQPSPRTKAQPSPRDMNLRRSPRQGFSNQSTPSHGSRRSTPRQHYTGGGNAESSLIQSRALQQSVQDLYKSGYNQQYSNLHRMDQAMYNGGYMYPYSPVHYMPVMQHPQMMPSQFVNPVTVANAGHSPPHMMPGYMGMDMSGQGEVRQSPRMEYWKHPHPVDRPEDPRIGQDQEGNTSK